MLTTIERRKFDSYYDRGRIISESNDLILIETVRDYQFDGFLVLRQRDISKAFTSEIDSFIEQVMRKEGRWTRIQTSIRKIPLNNWRDLLTARLGKPVGIENERAETFFLGPIVAADESSVLIHHCDACGEWKEIERVQYRRITSVLFDDQFSKVHFRNVPPRPEITND